MCLSRMPKRHGPPVRTPPRRHAVPRRKPRTGSAPSRIADIPAGAPHIVPLRPAACVSWHIARRNRPAHHHRLNREKVSDSWSFAEWFATESPVSRRMAHLIARVGRAGNCQASHAKSFSTHLLHRNHAVARVMSSSAARRQKLSQKTAARGALGHSAAPPVYAHRSTVFPQLMTPRRHRRMKKQLLKIGEEHLRGSGSRGRALLKRRTDPGRVRFRG